MSFLTEIRARAKRGPGSVEVIFADSNEVVEVPLRYPKAIDQAELTAFLESNKDDDNSEKNLMDYTDKLSGLMVKLCVKVDADETMSEEDITILVRESGGFQGALVQRCAQLLGLGNTLGNDGEALSRVKKGKKRSSTRAR